MTTLQKTMPGDTAICAPESDLTKYEGDEARRWNGPISALTVNNIDQGINLRMSIFRPGLNYLTPRHKHTTTHVRYIVSGTMNYGDEQYKAGDCMIIPDSVPYGPIVPGSGELPVFLQTTFMGPSGLPLPPPEELVRARVALRERGTIEDGVFTPRDGEPQDATEAAVEYLIGRKAVYPAPRLTDYLVVHTPELPWIPAGPGVDVKHVAYLFDTGPNVKLVRVERGAGLPSGISDCQQARYLIDGTVTWKQQSFDGISTMYYPAGMPYPETVGTSDTSTLLIIQWVNSGAPSPAYLDI